MNTNCLEGVQCPQCGNEDEFRIEAAVVCKVTDDGAEIAGDTEWTAMSLCLCPRCERAGILRDFMTPEETAQMRLGEEY